MNTAVGNILKKLFLFCLKLPVCQGFQRDDLCLGKKATLEIKQIY